MAYSEAEKRSALAVLEENNGNLQRAAHLTGITRNTLRNWQSQMIAVHAAVTEVVTTEKTELPTRLDTARALVDRWAAVQDKLLQVAEHSADTYIEDEVALEPDQLRHLMVGAGISSDKHLDHRDGRKGDQQINVSAQAGVQLVRNTRAIDDD